MTAFRTIECSILLSPIHVFQHVESRNDERVLDDALCDQLGNGLEWMFYDLDHFVGI